MEVFATNLKRIMQTKKLNNSSVAALTGIDQSIVSRWFNENRTPDFKNTVKLVKGLEITFEDLIKENKNESA